MGNGAALSDRAKTFTVFESRQTLANGNTGEEWALNCCLKCKDSFGKLGNYLPFLNVKQKDYEQLQAKSGLHILASVAKKMTI